MRKLLLLVVIFLSAFLLAGCSLPFGRGKKAALQITSNPKATVFLNGEHLGSTPFFDEKIKPGEYTVKLVPEAAGQQSLSWEGRVKLVAGVLTVISRDLGEAEEKSSGYVLSLEPKMDKVDASMAVVTVPDGAVVSLDGEPKGFAPISIENLSEGEHVLVISSPGFVEKSIKAKTVKGYKLTASVQLAKMPEEEGEEEKEATPSAEEEEEEEEEEGKASPTPKPTPKTEEEGGTFPRPYVLIKSPEVGWVRVREKATTASEELTKVNDGEKYKYLDSQSGWYKIEYEEGEVGWVSGRYAEVYK